MVTKKKPVSKKATPQKPQYRSQTSLVDWMKERGLDADYDTRAGMYETMFGGTYTGSPLQNMAMHAKLRKMEADWDAQQAEAAKQAPAPKPQNTAPAPKPQNAAPEEPMPYFAPDEQYTAVTPAQANEPMPYFAPDEQYTAVTPAQANEPMPYFAPDEQYVGVSGAAPEVGLSRGQYGLRPDEMGDLGVPAQRSMARTNAGVAMSDFLRQNPYNENNSKYLREQLLPRFKQERPSGDEARYLFDEVSRWSGVR